jgi:hypothetical protein
MEKFKPAKTKQTQPKLDNESQVRDRMYTPNYAVDLIAKYIPTKYVWECAAGDGRFGRRLEHHGYIVKYTEINGNFDYWNFLEKRNTDLAGEEFSIVTNPPFSLKEKFVRMCLQYGAPFALLLPLDYSIWMMEAIEKYGCEKLIPKRRISYITPNILKRIQYGEIWEIVKPEYKEIFKKYSELSEELWLEIVEKHSEQVPLFKEIDDVPNKLLAKYSSSDFHSGYLTWGFNFGKSETFVDLPISEIKGNIV